MRRYTIEGRLSDVIALISLTAVDEHAFRTIANLNDALRGKPQSAKKWDEVAGLHPEFFRFNGDKTNIALLIRSYLPANAQGHRAPVSIAETQKLIDTAIALHDKEIALKQKNSYLYSFIGSLIVAIIAVFGSVFGTIYNNRGNDTLNNKIDTLNRKLEKLELTINKSTIKK